MSNIVSDILPTSPVRWSDEQFRSLGVKDIVFMPAEQVRAIPPDKIQLLNPAVIGAMTPEQMCSMSRAQKQEMTEKQMQAVTLEQVKALASTRPHSLRGLPDYEIALYSLSQPGINMEDNFRKLCLSNNPRIQSFIWNQASERVQTRAKPRSTIGDER